MIDHRASMRYARAIFQLAEQENKLEEIAKGLMAVAELLNKHPEINRLVCNSTVSQAEKEDFLDKIVPSTIPPVVLNFLKVLSKKKRFHEALAVQIDFHELYETKLGIQEVKAIAAISLSEKIQKKLKEALKKKLNCEIRLITETDPKMIGGLILRFDDNEIDASYTTRIREIKQLLKR